MRPIPRSALAALVAAPFLLACAHAAHPSLPAPGTVEGLGVNIHFTDPLPGELEMLRATGFRWVRVDMTWSGIERRAGEYDFAAYDRLVGHLEKHGLKALFILDYGNPLHAEPGDRHPFTSRAGTPEFRAAYARWAAAAVKRYAGRGYLWEIWNEPNIAGFWQPAPDPAAYTAMAIAACRSIRTAAPGEAILGPGTSQVDLPFLTACLEAGLLEWWDAVSVHPYRQTAPETVRAEYAGLRRLIRRHAPPGKDVPVVCSEWGYSAAWQNQSEQMQADYAARQLLTNLTEGIPLTIWYDWRDDGDDPKEAEHRFGLVRRAHRPGVEPAFEPKPSWQAVRTLAAQLQGFTFDKRVQVPTYDSLPEPELLVFARDGAEKLVAWEPEPRDAPRALPLATAAASTSQDGATRQPVAPGRSGPARAGLDGSVRYVAPAARDPMLRLAAAWPPLPEEKELEVQAPVDRSFDLSFPNPLQAPVAITGRDQPVRPGEPLPSLARLSIPTRLTGPGGHQAALTAVLDAAPPGFLLQQSAAVRVLNPVHAEAGPPGPAGVALVLRNPSGQPWTGAARVTAQAAGQSPPAWTSIRLDANQREAASLIPAPAAASPEARLAVREGTAGAPVPDAIVVLPIPVPITAFQPADLTISPDGDATVEAAVKLEPGEPDGGPCPAGAPAVRAAVRFAQGWRFARIGWRPGTTPPAVPAQARALVCWLHGDLGPADLRVRLTDASGQTFQCTGTAAPGTDWRLARIPLDLQAAAHWGGANDGSPHPPLRLETPLLIDARRAPMDAVLHFAGLSWAE